MKNFKEIFATLLVLIGSVLFVFGAIFAFITTSMTIFYISIVGLFMMLGSVGLSID